LSRRTFEKIAVDWDRLEEGEDFQLVSPTAFFFVPTHLQIYEHCV